MQIYYLKCKKYTESVLRFSNGMPMLSCRCALYNNQKKIDLLKRRKWIYYETAEIWLMKIL